jgi:dTMP kinase
LNVDTEEAAKRSNYGEERYEKREIQKKVLEQFGRLIEEDQTTSQRFTKVDGAQTIENVHSNVLQLVDRAMTACKNKGVSRLWKL